MQSFFSRIKVKYKYAAAISVFCIAFLLMALLMPGESRFSYGFYKGKPWAHENYTARFSFPIYKSNDQIKAERDSILKDIKPYFSYNSALINENLSGFLRQFDEEWIQYSLKAYKIPSREEYLRNSAYLHLHKKQDYFREFIHDQLEKIYVKGIIEISGDSENADVSVGEIVFLKGNIAENKQISELLTPKKAYQLIHTLLAEEFSSYPDRRIVVYNDFLKNFEIERFINANVLYNVEISDREKRARIKGISLTEGIVQTGELIITKGEIVTQEKYRILESLRREYANEQGNVGRHFVRMGKFLLLLISLSLIYMFLYSFRKEVLRDLKKTSFILFLVTLMVFTASTTAQMGKISFYIIPFTILPIILRTFYDDRLALFMTVISILIIGVNAPDSFEFVFLNITAGIVAIFSLTNRYRRSMFFIAAILVVITYSICYFGISVVQEGNFSRIEYRNFAFFGINGVLILISFLLIYIFEKIFGFLSDTSLMELSDTNQPLLRKLAEVAPGTFQHSLQVASLSEEVIQKIGGNPLLVRAAALYHDIGKMTDPIFYIENQTSGINPHDNLEFEESAKIIIDHVIKGVDLAKKNKLPQPIIDFIKTHHGTSTVQYFYRSYIRKYPDKEIDLKKFSYPGPKPRTKEMAVLMMADSIEAASRSLKEYNYENISELVEKIIASQINDGQFEEASITFRDISEAKEVLKIRLRNIYHVRISYPKH